jgi:calcineurin-like phosphoesterase family protein
MTYFYTGDEHYGHKKIIVYCNRPFPSVEEMNEVIVDKHNEVVGPNDTVVHAGDFTLAPNHFAQKFIKRLNGKHIFVRGSHDSWLPKNHQTRFEMHIGKVQIVVDHYAGRVWSKSHYNSWQLYGHSHGGLPPIGKQWDVGVDNNDFYPVSFEQLLEIMAKQPDNFNLVRPRK